MGYYINPPGVTKEMWLRTCGHLTTESGPPGRDRGGAPSEHTRSGPTGPEVAVCWGVNPGFTFAAVAWCAEELRAFASPLDSRIKVWYWVPLADLGREVCGVDIASVLDPAPAEEDDGA